MIPSYTEMFTEEKIVDTAKVNPQCCLEENDMLLESVDSTHQVLASCKLVLQKIVPSTTMWHRESKKVKCMGQLLRPLSAKYWLSKERHFFVCGGGGDSANPVAA